MDTSFAYTFDLGTEMACLTIPWLGASLFLLLWGLHLRHRAFLQLPRPAFEVFCHFQAVRLLIGVLDTGEGVEKLFRRIDGDQLNPEVRAEG